VVEGRARGTNLPWTIDARELAAALELPRVGLLNDLEAMAWGVAALRPDDCRVLQAGAPGARGPMAIVAAGTGLGEAGVAWDGARHVPFACEGGHASFAPRGERERRLAAWLEARHGHVSWERVVSGQGLANLDEFLAHERGLARRREPAEVTHLALAAAQPDECAREALELMCALWGAEAANLALKLLATGGVWLAGGVAPKVLPELERGGCLAAFLDKGRLRRVLERMPLRVILDESTGLLGAARHAHSGAA
jgi:glucokinase